MHQTTILLWTYLSARQWSLALVSRRWRTDKDLTSAFQFTALRWCIQRQTYHTLGKYSIISTRMNNMANTESVCVRQVVLLIMLYARSQFKGEIFFNWTVRGSLFPHKWISMLPLSRTWWKYGRRIQTIYWYSDLVCSTIQWTARFVAMDRKSTSTLMYSR